MLTQYPSLRYARQPPPLLKFLTHARLKPAPLPSTLEPRQRPLPLLLAQRSSATRDSRDLLLPLATISSALHATKRTASCVANPHAANAELPLPSPALSLLPSRKSPFSAPPLATDAAALARLTPCPHSEPSRNRQPLPPLPSYPCTSPPLPFPLTAVTAAVQQPRTAAACCYSTRLHLLRPPTTLIKANGLTISLFSRLPSIPRAGQRLQVSSHSQSLIILHRPSVIL